MRSQEANLRIAAAGCLTQEERLGDDEIIVVAISGGPDSTALLHALAALRDELGVRLVAAHLNHGFRGAESDGDAEYVRVLCKSLGVPCYCELVDVPALRRRRHLSAQAAAREVRHAFLRRVASDVGARLIALGHTRDDRIETVLLNILRGSGLDGLAGIAAYDPPLIRPLLDVSRAETEAYCALYDLQPRHDSSNSKTDYRRNRLRAELLPHLASYYNQCIGDSLLRLSELASADTALLNTLAQEALRKVTLRAERDELLLDAAGVAELPLALRRRVLRSAIEGVRGDLRDVGMEATERILNALVEGRQRTEILPSGEQVGVEVASLPPTVRVRRLNPAVEQLPWRYALEIPGAIEIPQAELVLAAKRISAPFETFDGEWAKQKTLLYALPEITLPLTVRSWQPGDRIRPRGLGGSKKLQDLYTDRKIRGEDRLRFPVLIDATGRVLAVIGLQADEIALQLSDEASQNPVSGDYIVLHWK